MTGPLPAIFFLSDYGTADEFVGVVHAVLHRLAPDVPVIDLSHQVAPFDVAGGAAMLVRCAPHLGAGVVLAVVDPGVGTARRPVAIRTGAGGGGFVGPAWLVGPDNGLLLPMATACGGVESAVAIDAAVVIDGNGVPGPTATPGSRMTGPTFDGRDVFAPAAARLAVGVDPGLLGTSIDPSSLATAEPGARGPGAGTGGWEGPAPAGPAVVTAVASIDRFGNVQLEAGAGALRDLGEPPDRPVRVAVVTGSPGPSPGRPGPSAGGPGGPLLARRVTTFAELGRGELGLLVDGSGHLALVLDRASAAALLGPLATGSGVVITPVP